VVPGEAPAETDPSQPSLFDLPPHPERSEGPRSRPVAKPSPEQVRAAALSAHLKQLDTDQMTPIQALQELARIRDELEAE
jgi:hypothetical protein